MDVVATHPANRTLRGRASRTPGAVARVAEQNQRRSHAAGGTKGYRFVPFAIETSGRSGRAAVEVLGEWAMLLLGVVHLIGMHILHGSSVSCLLL